MMSALRLLGYWFSGTSFHQIGKLGVSGFYAFFCGRHINFLPTYCRSPSWVHRWELPVLRYPRNMVIYHYPLVGVIFMVTLHVFIIKNYPNSFSNYYPKYTF